MVLICPVPGAKKRGNASVFPSTLILLLFSRAERRPRSTRRVRVVPLGDPLAPRGLAGVAGVRACTAGEYGFIRSFTDFYGEGVRRARSERWRECKRLRINPYLSVPIRTACVRVVPLGDPLADRKQALANAPSQPSRDSAALSCLLLFKRSKYRK